MVSKVLFHPGMPIRATYKGLLHPEESQPQDASPGGGGEDSAGNDSPSDVPSSPGPSIERSRRATGPPHPTADGSNSMLALGDQEHESLSRASPELGHAYHRACMQHDAPGAGSRFAFSIPATPIKDASSSNTADQCERECNSTVARTRNGLPAGDSLDVPGPADATASSPAVPSRASIKPTLPQAARAARASPESHQKASATIGSSHLPISGSFSQAPRAASTAPPPHPTPNPGKRLTAVAHSSPATPTPAPAPPSSQIGKADACSPPQPGASVVPEETPAFLLAHFAPETDLKSPRSSPCPPPDPSSPSATMPLPLLDDKAAGRSKSTTATPAKRKAGDLTGQGQDDGSGLDRESPPKKRLLQHDGADDGRGNTDCQLVLGDRPETRDCGSSTAIASDTQPASGSDAQRSVRTSKEIVTVDHDEQPSASNDGERDDPTAESDEYPDPWAPFITSKELATLAQNDAWLSDTEVVPLAQMIASAGGKERFRHVHTSTEILTGHGAGHLEELLRSQLDDIMRQPTPPQILVTINSKNQHWVLGAADLGARKLRVYDSRLGAGHRQGAMDTMNLLAERVFAPVIRESVQQPEFVPWPRVEEVPCVQQDDGHNCGVHMLVNMMFLVTATQLPTYIHPLIWRAVLGRMLRGDSEPSADESYTKLVNGLANVSSALGGAPDFPDHGLPSAGLSAPSLLATAGQTLSQHLAVARAAAEAQQHTLDVRAKTFSSMRAQLAQAGQVLARLHTLTVVEEEVARRKLVEATVSTQQAEEGIRLLAAYEAHMSTSGSGFRVGQRLPQGVNGSGAADKQHGEQQSPEMRDHETKMRALKVGARRARLRRRMVLAAMARTWAAAGGGQLVRAGIRLEMLEKSVRRELEQTRSFLSFLSGGSM